MTEISVNIGSGVVSQLPEPILTSPGSNFTASAQATILYNELVWKLYFKISATSLNGKWVNLDCPPIEWINPSSANVCLTAVAPFTNMV